MPERRMVGINSDNEPRENDDVKPEQEEVHKIELLFKSKIAEEEIVI